MGLFHIIPADKRSVSAVISNHIKPGGNNHIHPLCRLCIFLKSAVCFLSGNLMEPQTHLFIHGNACINRRFKLTLRRDLLFLFQTPVLHISDITVFRSHFRPFIHRFQHLNRTFFRKLCNDVALDSALYPEDTFFADLSGFYSPPYRIYKYTFDLAGIKGLLTDI